MVLTEAFASGTPVVASDIAGYRDVVRDGVDGVLVPPADPAALGEALLDLAHRPRAPRADGAPPPRERAQRFAWPHVAEEVPIAYEDAIELPRPETPDAPAPARGSASSRAEPGPARSARGACPRSSPSRPAPGAAALSASRAASPSSRGAVAGVGLAALALDRIGIEPIVDAMLAATPVWVLARVRAHVRSRC